MTLSSGPPIRTSRCSLRRLDLKSVDFADLETRKRFWKFALYYSFKYLLNFRCCITDHFQIMLFFEILLIIFFTNIRKINEILLYNIHINTKWLSLIKGVLPQYNLFLCSRYFGMVTHSMVTGRNTQNFGKK